MTTPLNLAAEYQRTHHMNSPASRLTFDVLERHFDEYDTLDTARHDVRCILEYMPEPVNAGCAAVYYADIATECNAAGYSGLTDRAYVRLYNAAISRACRFILSRSCECVLA